MRVRYLVGFLIFITTAGFLFLFWQIGNVVEFYNPNNSSSTISLSEKIKIINNIVDDETPQKPLADPPETIKAIYSTGWSAGSESRLNYLIQLIKNSELNAVVIDIKDYSGYVDYDIKLKEVEKYKAKEIKIPKITKAIIAPNKI